MVYRTLLDIGVLNFKNNRDGLIDTGITGD